jgi:hypothetical protein
MKAARSETERKMQIVGWLLFILCAVIFIWAAVRAGDGLMLAGSIVFLAACLIFITPLLREPGSGKDQP